MTFKESRSTGAVARVVLRPGGPGQSFAESLARVLGSLFFKVRPQ